MTRVRSTSGTGPSKSVEAEAESAMLRGATDLAIAQRRREVAERHMKQQKEAQLLNERRKELQARRRAH